MSRKKYRDMQWSDQCNQICDPSTRVEDVPPGNVRNIDAQYLHALLDLMYCPFGRGHTLYAFKFVLCFGMPCLEENRSIFGYGKVTLIINVQQDFTKLRCNLDFFTWIQSIFQLFAEKFQAFNLSIHISLHFFRIQNIGNSKLPFRMIFIKCVFK